MKLKRITLDVPERCFDVFAKAAKERPGETAESIMIDGIEYDATKYDSGYEPLYEDRESLDPPEDSC